jgi:two-component system response regulator AdeR
MLGQSGNSGPARIGGLIRQAQGNRPEMTTIVLAEDDADLRGMYATYLRSAGFNVLEAPDGEQALHLVRAHRPPLLLLDIWMPLMNGFEVLASLRHDSAAACTKVMMLSCLGDADARLECFGVGAAEYLVKGLPLADLLKQVKRSLASRPSEAAPEPS